MLPWCTEPLPKGVTFMCLWCSGLDELSTGSLVSSFDAIGSDIEGGVEGMGVWKVVGNGDGGGVVASCVGVTVGIDPAATSVVAAVAPAAAVTASGVASWCVFLRAMAPRMAA